jgi:DNA-binding transcriptional MerR regulator/methylmalonyl-CoA mutase cobalamin-binding subunit
LFDTCLTFVYAALVPIYYPVQVVVRQTGLTPHVLRAWEKRYGAVRPTRSESGRRLYSDLDLRRLKLLSRITKQGHPIGNVATLPDEALENLAKQTTISRDERPRGGKGSSNRERRAIVRDCLAAIERFDSDGLNRILKRAVLEAGYTAVVRQVIAPLAQRLGELWSEGILQTSHEHFASGVIRAFLLDPARQYSGTPPNTTLVASTLQGQLHELGVVMAAALAAERGWRVIYLGPSLPALEIASVAMKSEARVVVLSMVYPEAEPQIENELRELRNSLSEETPILIGGSGAESYRAVIDELRVQLVEDFGAFQVALAKIRATGEK